MFSPSTPLCPPSPTCPLTCIALQASWPPTTTCFPNTHQPDKPAWAAIRVAQSGDWSYLHEIVYLRLLRCGVVQRTAIDRGVRSDFHTSPISQSRCGLPILPFTERIAEPIRPNQDGMNFHRLPSVLLVQRDRGESGNSRHPAARATTECAPICVPAPTCDLLNHAYGSDTPSAANTRDRRHDCRSDESRSNRRAPNSSAAARANEPWAGARKTVLPGILRPLRNHADADEPRPAAHAWRRQRKSNRAPPHLCAAMPAISNPPSLQV